MELDPSVTQVTKLDQVAELYGVCAQDNETLRFRAAKVSELRYRVAGESSPGNIQGHEFLLRSCYLAARIGQGSRWEWNGNETRRDEGQRGGAGIAPNKYKRQIVERGAGGYREVSWKWTPVKIFFTTLSQLAFPFPAILRPRLPAVELRGRVRQVSPLDTVKTLFETLSSACRPRPWNKRAKFWIFSSHPRSTPFLPGNPTLLSFSGLIPRTSESTAVSGNDCGIHSYGSTFQPLVKFIPS